MNIKSLRTGDIVTIDDSGYKGHLIVLDVLKVLPRGRHATPAALHWNMFSGAPQMFGMRISQKELKGLSQSKLIKLLTSSVRKWHRFDKHEASKILSLNHNINIQSRINDIQLLGDGVASVMINNKVVSCKME